MLAPYSNWGTCLDVLAPGTNILSATIGDINATRVMNGTSMAAPHVSGALALILSATSGTLTSVDVKAKLLSMASNQTVSPTSSTTTRVVYVLESTDTTAIQGLSTAVIVGICVGGAVVLSLLISGGYLMWRWKSGRPAAPDK